jgi:hypothetical protein
MKNTELVKALAVAWRELSEEEKKVFNDKTEAEKAKYEKEMVTYKASQP